MKTVSKVKEKGRGRRIVTASDETHRQLKVIAALDGTTVEAAFDRYAAPAVAKAFEQKTAPTK